MVNKKWRGVPVVSWLLAGVLLLAACAPAAQQPTAGQQPVGEQQPAAKAEPADKKTRLTAVYPTDLEGRSPYSHSTSTLYARWMHVMDPLVRWDPEKAENVPHLAESWTNPDENTWLFKLRQGVKFHDGSEFTAEDVVHSFNRITNDKDSKQFDDLKHVDEIEAVDKYTVRMHTKNPDAAFLFRLNNLVMSSKAHFDKLGMEQADKNPIGTGPYKFQEWLSGQRFVVVKNPDFWGPNQPTFDEVVFRVISEPEASLTALLNGEADIIGYIPPQLISRVENSNVARLASTRGQRLMFLAMNPAFEPWDNKLLRQAVAHAIDTDALIQGVLEGRGYRLDTPIGPGMYAYDPELEPRYNYDPEKAKQLVAEAGHPNGVDVIMRCPNGRYTKDKELCEAMVPMLEKVGIRAKLETPEWGKFWGDVNEGKQPFYLLGRGNVVDPSEYLHQYFRTGVTKRIGFSNPEIDQMLLAEQREFDPEERVKLLRQAMSSIMQAAPMHFLFQYQDTYGVSNEVEWQARSDEYILAWEAKPKQ